MSSADGWCFAHVSKVLARCTCVAQRKHKHGEPTHQEVGRRQSAALLARPLVYSTTCECSLDEHMQILAQVLMMIPGMLSHVRECILHLILPMCTKPIILACGSCRSLQRCMYCITFRLVAGFEGISLAASAASMILPTMCLG